MEYVRKEKATNGNKVRKVLKIAGLAVMISAAMNLAEGLTSLLASKSNRFAAPASTCSLLAYW